MALISKDGVATIPELKGKTVGTVDGWLWVRDLRAYLGDALKTYADPVSLYQDLKAGRIDVVVDGYGSGRYSAPDAKTVAAPPSELVGVSREPGQSTFPVPPANRELLAAINDGIAELRKSGELAKILANHDLDPAAAEPGEPRLIK